MIFSIKEGFINTEGFEEVRYKEYTFYYSGILYLRGKKAGRESVLAVAEEYEATGVIPFIKIFGAFCLIICKPDGKTIFFTDNSNLHCFFIGKNYIGDNFLEIIRCEKANEFNIEALCEFFVLGGVYFGKTLIDGIKVTANDSFYMSEDGIMVKKDKKIGGIDAPSSITDVSAFFRDMAYALSDCKVTLSLTGGYDSRMVFACTKDYLPTNVFISGDNENDPDIVCAKKTARAGGQHLEILKIDKPQISENYLRELFEYAQGCVPLINDGYLRISMFMKNRRANGYNCYLTGDGGPRHKDWYWMQDLPFYRKKNTNVPRFYDQRIEEIRTDIPFGDILIVPYRNLRQRFIGVLEQHVMSINTQSYDSFGFNIFGDTVKVNYSIHSKTIRSYAPLWELELVRYSYHLPRRKRFFYNSMREITTKNSRSIARVPTVYGTTASSEPLYILRDILFQGIDYYKKAVRMLGRMFLNRNFFIGNVSTWSAEDDVRSLDISQRALSYCIDKEYIKQDTQLKTVSYNTLGRMLQVYMLAEEMDKNDGDSN